ncbi:MAG: nucleotide sugar dehydrogenase [Acidobacteria bacterium]|nr:nucleotide sugar dehydrogenase [Acidobacteriota bacterium]
MKVTMIGTGYVGLVTGTCFADFGLDVTCADINADKIAMLEGGEVPFYEPGLSEKIEQNVAAGRLTFSTEVGTAIQEADAVFIAVGTPAREDGATDLSYIEAVARDIGRNLNGYKVIATKSTVPPQTGARIRELLIEEAGPDAEFDVVSNPEFLREGSAVDDFMRPDRIVVGADSARAVDLMKALYRPLYLIETPFVITSVASAEMIKYASNAFLAVKITFINEVANICERVDADVHVVAKSMGLDGRISPKFLHPGPGFGGSCFPKDVASLVSTGERNGYEFLVGRAALEANERQRDIMTDKIRAAADGLEGKRIGFLGLAFKPNTDDVRESPAIEIIERVLDAGATVSAFDPAAMETGRDLLGDRITYAEDTYSAAADADVLVIATEWNQFRNLDFARLREIMKRPAIVDLRNVYSPDRMRDQDFHYTSVGR